MTDFRTGVVQQQRTTAVTLMVRSSMESGAIRRIHISAGKSVTFRFAVIIAVRDLTANVVTFLQLTHSSMIHAIHTVGWRFSLVVTRWSRSTKLLYAGPR